MSFEGDTGASSHFELAEDHAQMEIHFLRQPGGGVLTVEASGQKFGDVETERVRQGARLSDLPA